MTPAGRILVTHGRAVLRLLENAEAQLAQHPRGEPARPPGMAVLDPPPALP
jgi:DNA-binding transcriptional LysR family regulator